MEHGSSPTIESLSPRTLFFYLQNWRIFRMKVFWPKRWEKNRTTFYQKLSSKQFMPIAIFSPRPKSTENIPVFFWFGCSVVSCSIWMMLSKPHNHSDLHYSKLHLEALRKIDIISVRKNYSPISFDYESIFFRFNRFGAKNRVKLIHFNTFF